MGYFDGLVDASFKRDPAGKNMLFYPWGVLGSGIILESEEKYLQVRKTIKRLTIISLIITFITLVTLGGLITVTLLPPYIIGYYFVVRKITNGLPKTEEKLRVLEAYKNSARSHNWSTLVFLQITGFVMMLGAIWQLMQEPQQFGLLLPLAGGVFFGFCNCVFIYMMITKYKNK